MNFARLKKLFVYGLIGSLIVSALVAVFIVLFGEFNEITNKVFLTLLMVVIHLLIGLIFVWNEQSQETFNRLKFFTNILFVLIVISFLTSIFGTWDAFPGDLVARLYQSYFVFGFASLYGNVLSKALYKEKYINMIVYANYIFLLIIVFMFMPVIFINNARDVLSNMFFRVFGAAGIIDGTLSILTIIFYKLYMHKHPELENTAGGQGGGRSVSVSRILILLFIIFFVVPMLFSFVFRTFSGF